MAESGNDTSNVIYANFGTRVRVAGPEELKPVPHSSYGPAGHRLWSTVSQGVDEKRIERGRRYFTEGHVIDMSLLRGSIEGSVAGSQNKPFSVRITLPYRSSEDLNEVINSLVNTPNAVNEAARGHFSAEFLDILIAEESDELHTDCTCPDYVRPCKHVLALASKASQRLDVDPLAVFQLRGFNFADIQEMVAASAAAKGRESTEEGSDSFFLGHELPELPEPSPSPALDDSDLDLLHKAMRGVSFTTVDQLRAVSDIEDLYDHLIR